jgi:hypothetical protein
MMGMGMGAGAGLTITMGVTGFSGSGHTHTKSCTADGGMRAESELQLCCVASLTAVHPCLHLCCLVQACEASQLQLALLPAHPTISPCHRSR